MSEIIKCLVVDDEPIAQDILVGYINQITNLELVGTCINAIEANNVLQKEHVDLVLLDIEMPMVNGLNFLANLESPPKVIITTAYRDFAVEGFELNAVDYLLKPISIERFMKAVQKITIAAIAEPYSEESFIYLKADKKMVQIVLSDILYIEGLSNYVKIYLTDRMVISYQKLSYLEKVLPAENFLRIHRSFIVSRSKIRSYTSTFIDVADVELPIGGSYKTGVLEKLKANEG
ncbi:LytR/AlgR family response regulator transcription factor [Ekhidna sp. To15]|uniref:LytR/AlgR family response regulator transcription factor n=1 Tax=Ekhidna sp. To15 TaxID=3395267 RepID=UPI003F51B2D9